MNSKKQKVSTPYQSKTGQRCHCRPGVQRDNCPACEGTGWQVDFAAIRQRSLSKQKPPTRMRAMTYTLYRWAKTSSVHAYKIKIFSGTLEECEARRNATAFPQSLKITRSEILPEDY